MPILAQARKAAADWVGFRPVAYPWRMLLPPSTSLAVGFDLDRR